MANTPTSSANPLVNTPIYGGAAQPAAPSSNTATQSAFNNASPYAASTTPAGTTTAPAVITANQAATTANNAQTNVNNKVAAGATIQSAKSNLTTTYDVNGNMVQTGGLLPNGSTYTNTIAKGAPGYVANPVEVKSLQDQISSKQKELATAQAQQKEEQNTAALTSAAAGTIPTPTQPTSTPQTYDKPSSITPPTTTSDGIPIDVTTPQGQAQWYNQDPQGFETWAKDQGISSDQQFQVQVTAGTQKLQSLQTQGNNYLQQYLSGTFPLTASQQAQVSGLQQMWQGTINAQTNANQTYVSASTMASARQGGEYDPLGSVAEANRAIQTGLDRINEFQGAETAAVNAMIQGFQDNDYKAVTNNLDVQEKLTADITNNLKTVNDSIVKARDDANAQAEQTRKDATQAVIDNHTMSLQDKQQALDQMKFTETQKVDAQTALDNSVKNSIAEADLKLKQATFNADYGVTSLPADFQPTDIPGVKSIAPGVTYFDPTQFNDPKQAKQAEKTARTAGVAVVDPKDAPNAEQLTSALDSLQQAQTAFDKIATPNYLGSVPITGVENIVGGTFKNVGLPTDYQNNISAYNTQRADIIKIASTLTGGNSRALSKILEQLNNVMPKSPGGGGAALVPTTASEAASKFNSARQIIYSGIKVLVPNAVLPASGAPIYTNSTDFIKENPTITLQNGTTQSSQEAYSSAIDSVHELHPNYSKAELDQAALQLINN